MHVLGGCIMLLRGGKAFLATYGTDPTFLLSLGLSVLLSFPHSPSDHDVPSMAAAEGTSCFPGADGESRLQILEKAQSKGMWSTVGFHSPFPGHDNNT